MWYDEEEDVLGVQIIKEGYWKSIELPSGITIDISKKVEILGVEILKASKVFSGDVARVIKLAKQNHKIKAWRKLRKMPQDSQEILVTPYLHLKL